MTTGAEGSTRSPMRARFREQVRENVKAVALTQLADGGAAAVSVNAIAKQLGVSGPALYRYFANRDELLADLVVDAYHDFAEALAVATRRDLGLSPLARLHALADAWRAFARGAPHRYQLLFAPPVPGYDAHSERLVTASRRAMEVGLDVYADLAAHASSVRAPEDPDRLGPVLSAWCRLHGFVILELGGNFVAMGVDADALFRREVAGLPDRTTGTR